MITDIGLVLANRTLADALVSSGGVAIGTGGADPVYGISIAPSNGDTGLKNQIFFSQSIDSVATIEPPTSDHPRISVTHTFYARNVVPNGTPVGGINEFGIFVKNPKTGLFELLLRQTFDSEEFIVPATGQSVSRSAVTLTIEFGLV